MAVRTHSATTIAVSLALAVSGCGTVVAAAEAASCGAQPGDSIAACAARESALLQTRRTSVSRGAWPWSRHPKNVTSDCATRLNRTEGNAACIVVRSSKALLVWVPYGGAPGWDLPGGFRKDGEAACETAEREVCEETGMQVRAVKQVSDMVYECEVVSEHICKNPVDEGFLSKYWAAMFELGNLEYRGNTWGDKEALLRDVLSAVPAQQSSKFRWPWQSLVQSTTGVAGNTAVVAKRTNSPGAASECAARLDMRNESNAGCVVVRDGKGLLVWVPYGSSPGWDLPGGWKHSGEAACETAERETCEESGVKVRALKPLSANVFLCEVIAEDSCTNPVDEGFLQKKWVTVEELDGLQYRAYTWGDKADLLRTALLADAVSTRKPETTPAPAATVTTANLSPGAASKDACGCEMCSRAGFSTTSHSCQAGKVSSAEEMCSCLRKKDAAKTLDACGCDSCAGMGWSTVFRRCMRFATTQPWEGCLCQNNGKWQTLVQRVA